MRHSSLACLLAMFLPSMGSLWWPKRADKKRAETSPKSPTSAMSTNEVVDELYRRTVEEDHAIEQLFQQFNCTHAYLDLGGNIGVQTRKVYEPAFYPSAPVLALYNSAFGPGPRCDVCSILIEANPLHGARLAELTQSYRSAGVGAIAIMAAVSDADGVTRMVGFNRTDGWIKKHGGTTLQISARTSEPGDIKQTALERVSVRTVDLARIILSVRRAMQRQRHRNNIFNLEELGESGTASVARGKIVAKFDIEGAEHRALPHLIRTNTMCLIDRAYIEWHGDILKDWVFKSLNQSAKWSASVNSSKSAKGKLRRRCATAAQLADDLKSFENAPDLYCPPGRLCDDESYRHDGMPFPTKPICTRRTAV